MIQKAVGYEPLVSQPTYNPVMAGRRTREPEEQPTFEYGSKHGIRVTITGEDGTRITYFGGKQSVKITVTSMGSPVELLSSSTVDPAEDGYAERPGKTEA
jgi:hypothetical protein